MANIRITELDFDGIKENLKEFLNSQEEFTDYDFEGSGLSVLLDILAYNTHYNAYLANQLVNEMFLDSAVKRSSAVSIAKHLGYIPRSTVGSIAVLDITVTDPVGNPSSLTLDRYTPFITTIDGSSYTFMNLEAITIKPNNGIYTFSDVAVKEGFLVTNSFIVTAPSPDEKYIIPNDNVDISTISVSVQVSGSDTTTEIYERADSILELDDTSKVFFIEENTLGRYQIFFGDGVLGKSLEAGNIIRITYLSSTGSDTNVSSTIEQSFSVAAPIGGSTDISIATVGNSSGGGVKESLASIKFNAPRAYSAKGRAVTASDYDVIIRSSYPEVKSLAVWGGEDNVPPIYGKVFIALLPESGFVISDATTIRIKNEILSSKKMVTTFVEFVDPDYLYVNLECNVQYNKKLTNLTSSQIGTLVTNEVRNFFNQELEQFGKNFYHSSLVSSLLDVEPSIVSILVNITLQRRILPILNVNNSYNNGNIIQFGNRLHPGNFRSTRFYIISQGNTVPVYIADVPDSMPPNYDGTGTLYIYNADTDVRIDSTGTINYATGDVEVLNLNVVGFPQGQFDIRFNVSVQEDDMNIKTIRGRVIVLDDSILNEISNRESGLSVNVTAI